MSLLLGPGAPEGQLAEGANFKETNKGWANSEQLGPNRAGIMEGAVHMVGAASSGKDRPPHGSNAPWLFSPSPSDLLLQLLLIELYWKTEGEGAPVMQLNSLGRC